VMQVVNRAGLAGAELVEASPWHSARAGLVALLRDRPVLVLTVAVAVIWLLYAPTESVLLPVHFEATDQPEAFGLVVSAISVGGMVGAFGYGRIARRISRHRLATTCMLLAGVTYLPLALLPAPVVMIVPALLLGLAWGPMEPLLNSVVQDRFPEHQHGRVYGVQLSIFYSAPPLGQLIVGAAVEGLGVETVFLWVAGLLLAFVTAVAALPVLRGLNDPQPTVSRPAA
jgi:MFS family permease